MRRDLFTSIPSLAFINPTNTTDLEQLLGGPDTGMNCLIGLSFDGLSVVNHNIIEAFGEDTTIGQTSLSNIFQQTKGIDTSIDIHLQRSVDLEQTDSGEILIGEHDNSLVDVTKQKPLPTVSDRQWVVGVDAIKLNNRSLSLGNSAVPALQNQKMLGGLLDSGTSALVLPDAIVSEVFAAIPGAFFDESDGVFIVPCLQSANLSITMGCVV
jgi:saccharopepsin